MFGLRAPDVVKWRNCITLRVFIDSFLGTQAETEDLFGKATRYLKLQARGKKFYKLNFYCTTILPSKIEKCTTASFINT